MNIVTVMNYDWDNKNYVALCYLWIKQAELWLKETDCCIIFSRNSLPKILLDKMQSSKTCQFRNSIHNGCDKKIVFPSGSFKSRGANFTYKFSAICSISFPFVFIDADAIIVSDINKIREVHNNQSQPIICIDHEQDEQIKTANYPPFINSGVMLINDPYKEIINWNKIYDYGLKHRFIFYFRDSKQIIPGTDQAILKSYLDSIQYNYRHEEIDASYNPCSFGVKFSKNNNGVWEAYKNNQHMHIVHYWYEYKPWSNIQCPMFQEVINDEMFSSSIVMA